MALHNRKPECYTQEAFTKRSGQSGNVRSCACVSRRLTGGKDDGRPILGQFESNVQNLQNLQNTTSPIPFVLTDPNLLDMQIGNLKRAISDKCSNTDLSFSHFVKTQFIKGENQWQPPSDNRDVIGRTRQDILSTDR